MSRAVAKAAARNLARIRTLESLAVPEPGEVVQLPGGLQAVAGEVAEPGELCEMCGEACGVRTIVYLVPLPIVGDAGGGHITVHAACLGGCR